MLEHLTPTKPTVALLGTYLALYDQAFPGYREKMLDYARRIAGELANEICFSAIGAACNESEAESFLNTAKAAGVDAVLLLSLGYTNSLSVTRPLIQTPLPLVFFNTQSLVEVTPEFVFTDLVDNHGMQGVQDLACVLVRQGRAFEIVTGLASQPETRAELAARLRAIRAVNQIRGSRIGCFGASMPGMGDAQVEPAQLKAAFGLECLNLDYAQLARAAAEAPADEIEAARLFDRAHFAWAPDLGPADHERSLRLELGLRQLVREHALAGLQLSFEQAAVALETIPFLGISKLLADGVAYAGEGDLLGTAGGVLTRYLCGEVNFTEMYTMDFRRNAVLDTHMAEGNWRMARRDRKPCLLRREFTLADCQPFCALTFSLEPGDVTLFSLTLTAAGRFHFIVLEAQVDDFPPLAGLEIPNFKLRFQRDLRPILNEYSLAGGTHHLSLAYGRQAARFEHLARRLGCAFTWIRTE